MESDTYPVIDTVSNFSVQEPSTFRRRCTRCRGCGVLGTVLSFIKETILMTVDGGHVTATLIAGSVATLIIVVILSYIIRPDKVTLVSVHWLIITVHIIGMVVIVVISALYASSAQPQREERYTKLFLWTRMVSLIAFGFLSVILNFTSLLGLIGCSDSIEIKTQMAFDIIQGLFILFQIIFIFTLGNKQFIFSTKLQYFLKSLVVVNVSICAFVLITDVNVDGTIDDNGVNNSLCSKNSSLSHIHEDIEPFFKPFIVEFALMAAGLLLEIKIVPTEGALRSESDEEDSRHDVEVESRNQIADQSRGYTVGSLSKSSLGITIVLAAVCMILFNILEAYVPDDSKDLNYSTILTLSYTWYLFMMLIYGTVCYIGFRKLRTNIISVGPVHSIELNDVMLMVCAFGLIMYIALRFFACLNLLSDQEVGIYAWLLFVASIFNIWSIWLQTALIITSNDIARKQTFASGQGIMNAFLFLAIFNFGVWVMDSFIMIQHPKAHPVDVKYYGLDTWLNVSHILVPVTIFYRFESFLSFIKLISRFLPRTTTSSGR